MRFNECEATARRKKERTVVPSHLPELLLVVLIGLLVFGSKRLPEMGSAVGKTIREFQKSMREVTAPPTDANSTAQMSTVVRPAEPPQIAAPTPPSAPAAGPAATEQAKEQDSVAG